jgi:CheY-like chemotaxis protein
MALLLEQWGCQVLTALDLPAALQVLDGQAPELILADYHLDHGITGTEVLQALREHFKQAIPALVISADRSDACRRELQALGVAQLNKPVKPGKLRALLSQLLQEV